MRYMKNHLKLRVLLIAADADLSQRLAPLFERAGFELVYFGKSAALPGVMRESKPDLVIIEDAPPDVEGCRTCRLARRLSDTPIIMLGNGHNAEASVRALISGADFYLARPFGYAHLVARAKALVRRARGEVITPIVKRGRPEATHARTRLSDRNHRQ